VRSLLLSVIGARNDSGLPMKNKIFHRIMWLLVKIGLCEEMIISTYIAGAHIQFKAYREKQEKLWEILKGKQK
jgi:hypothetical protein